MASDITANTLQEITYVGEMNYARTRLLDNRFYDFRITKESKASNHTGTNSNNSTSWYVTFCINLNPKQRRDDLPHLEQYMKQLWPAYLR